MTLAFLALAGIWVVYYFFLGGSGKVTAWQLRFHPESTLTYPHSYGVASAQRDEDDADAWFRIANTDPTPAIAETQFYTADPVAGVIAWYADWLSVHGWQDVVVQGDGERYWDRGRNEEFAIACGRQNVALDLWCDAQYRLLSSRFTQSYAPAPSFGDPVSRAAVEQRVVGLGAVDGSLRDPQDGTAAGDAARAAWPNQIGAQLPVIVKNVSAAEQTSPSRSAYHVITIQAPEYDLPSATSDLNHFGRFETLAARNFQDAGFTQVGSEQTNMFGAPAQAFALVREDREAVFYAISYGPSTREPAFGYRVATLSVIYDVAPKACPLTRSGCLDTLFKGDASTGWTY